MIKYILKVFSLIKTTKKRSNRNLLKWKISSSKIRMKVIKNLILKKMMSSSKTKQLNNFLNKEFLINLNQQVMNLIMKNNKIVIHLLNKSKKKIKQFLENLITYPYLVMDLLLISLDLVLKMMPKQLKKQIKKIIQTKVLTR